MAYGVNGSLNIGQDPYGDSSSSLNRARNYKGSYRKVWSVNEPITVSALWNGGLNENQEPSAENATSSGGNQFGDVVNLIFDIYQVSDSDGITFPDDWTLVGSIRKSRDIRNISQRDRLDGGDGLITPTGHTFTVDISEICRDLLSYSLVPHGKGTFTSTFFGGLNGGAEQQGNLIRNVWSDDFIVTKNGSVRCIKVRIRSEIINDDGLIKEATYSGSTADMSNHIYILNTALDYDGYFPASRRANSAFYHSGWGTSNRFWRSCMTKALNGYWGGGGYQWRNHAKSVRMDEAAEFLQFGIADGNNYGIYYGGFDSGAGETKENPLNTSDLIDDIYIQVSAYDENGGFLRKAKLYDFTENLIEKTTINSVTGVYPRYQWRMCAQNISPVYINANCIYWESATKAAWEYGGQTYTRWKIDNDGGNHDKTSLFLNDEVYYYRLTINGITTTQGNGTGADRRFSEYRYYKIDRDRWLNTIREPYQNIDYYYAGIYYTELRSDQMTLTNPVRCKGIRYNVISNRPDYFRVHWLNKCGGIDSYTLKGYKSTSYNAEKDIIQRKEPNRFDVRYGSSSAQSGYLPYPSNNAPTKGNYKSDYMGHSMNYKGGLEVLNVNATKSGTATTLPLSASKADWLREIITSPNVWTENLTMQTKNGTPDFNNVNYRGLDDLKDGHNVDGRTPNNMEYVPLIITNSSVDIYDEAKGLVTITIEYTHSHAVVTQRN